MSSWVQLLALLLAACLRVCLAEGDPLPAALVELVRTSPISSIEDLHLLLLSDSIEVVDESSPANGHRLPRSLEAQPAQRAVCKVRTEVVEVTRAMLDRSNANFLLWPPCVEVQRCSGCCNTKSLRCVPVLTHTRYLQVVKMQYIDKKPIYAKAVVSVVDHVECRCQAAPPPPAPRKKSSRRQQAPDKDQHLNQTFAQTQGKTQSKEELHRYDELKQNQRVHLEEQLEQHWRPRGDTYTRPGEEYSLAREDASRSGETVLYTPHWVQNATRLLGTREGPENIEWNDGRNMTLSSTDTTGDVLGIENKVGEGGDLLLLNNTEKGVQMEGSQQKTQNYSEENGDGDPDPQRQVTQIDRPLLQKSGSDASENLVRDPVPQVTQAPETTFSSFEAVDQRAGRPFRPTKEPNPDPVLRRDNITPAEKTRLQIEEEKLEEEKRELQKRLDQEKERQLRQTQTTTQKFETSPTTTTRRPSTAGGRRPPARPHPPKRRRKNRKRISKAALRAMLM